MTTKRVLRIGCVDHDRYFVYDELSEEYLYREYLYRDLKWYPVMTAAEYEKSKEEAEERIRAWQVSQGEFNLPHPPGWENLERLILGPGTKVTADPIQSHEGSKYLRTIRSAVNGATVEVDVYDVIVAFKGPECCPAQAHAIKKLLCTGNRGKGDELADLIGAKAAINRAIELQGLREK